MGAVLQQKPKNAIRFDADKVRARIDARMLADYAGEVYGNDPERCGSEWRIGKGHRSGPGSGLAVSDRDGAAVWHDHSTGDGGDVFVFVWREKMGGSGAIPPHRFGEVVAQTVEAFGIDPADVAAKQAERSRDTDGHAKENHYDEVIAMYWGRLRAGVGDVSCDNWLSLRGLPRGVLADCANVGWTTDRIDLAIRGVFSAKSVRPCIYKNSLVVRNPHTKSLKVIPFGDDGGRVRDGNKRDIKQEGGACVWIPWETEPDGGDVYVTEGETSAIALLAYGFAAIPVKPEGKGKAVLRDLAGRHRIILAYDNDEAGRKYANDALRIAPEALNLAPIFDEGDDPNDYARKHGADTAGDIADAIPGLVEASKALADAVAIPGEYRHALEAMEACKKPRVTKGGDVVLEYERGDVYPLVEWLRNRGVYLEEFANDNGLRRADGQPLTSGDLTREQIAIQNWGGMPAMGTAGPRLMRQAAEYVAEGNRRDALRERIEALPTWDGVQRIDTFWSRYAGAEQTETTKGVARYMWTAIIGRALATKEHPCKADMCVILKGQTGIGKTSFVKALALQIPWFMTLSQDVPEDEIKRKLRLAQIVEIGEMTAATKGQRETLKRVLTEDTISMRKKGNDDHWFFANRSFFCATSDNADGILNDPNSFRRWLPVEVRGFIPVQRGDEAQYVMDTEGLRNDIAQIYAEARELYTSRVAEGLNGVWWDAVPLAGQRAAAERATVGDDNADLIYAWFEKTGTCEAALWRICAEALGIYKDAFARDKRLQMQLTEALKLRGFVKRQCRGEDGKLWYWHHPDFWTE